MVRLLQAIVLVLILFQRLAVPVGDQQLSALVPVLSLLILAGWAAGGFRVERRRLVLVAIVIGTAVALTLVQIVAGTVPSLLSVGLLIVLYLPAALAPQGDADTGRRVGRFFVGLMAVAAVVSLAQYASQSLGYGWRDWVALTVPKAFVLQDFNVGNAITFGSSIDRATALVFLEPSFLSLFLGLAVVVALQLRMRWPVVTLLLLGIVPTVAGNGLVLVGIAVVVMLFRPGRARLVALVPSAVLVAIALAVTPFLALYLQRSTEGGDTNTSTGLRFVQPYLQLLPVPLQDPLTALIGKGAGASSVYIVEHFTEPLLATALPKVLFEFGLLGVLGVLLPLLILFIRPLRRQPELLGLLIAFFVVNAALLTALLVYLAILALLWLPDLAARPVAARVAEPGRAEPEPALTA